MAVIQGEPTEVTRDDVCPVDEVSTTWVKYAANQIQTGNVIIRVWWVCTKCGNVVGVSANPTVKTV
jgi:hypothetical protein